MSQSVLVTKTEVPATAAQGLKVQLQNIVQDQLDSLTGQKFYGSLSCTAIWRVTDERMISGMAKKKIMRFALDLSFYDEALEEDFGRLTIPLSGSGGSVAIANNAALEKLRMPQKQLKAKVAAVIAEHQAVLSDCVDVVARFETLRSTDKNAVLLALSNHINGEHPCSDLVGDIVSSVYEEQQRAACSQSVRQAKLALASANVHRAVALLSSIDPATECDAEIDELLDQLIEHAQVKDLQRLDWHLRYRDQRYDRYAARIHVISQTLLKSSRNDGLITPAYCFLYNRGGVDGSGKYD